MKVIGILPVKENSVRIPGKNFRMFNGAPLWMHSLGNLARSGICDKIVINTDVPEQFMGTTTVTPLEVELRSEEFWGDDVSMNLILHDIALRHVAEIYVQIHATSPFVEPDRFRKSLKILEDSGADCAVSYTQHLSRFEDPQGNAINHMPGELLQTQALAPLYEENSAFYMYRRDIICRTGNRAGGQRARIVTDPIESIDIDFPGDMALAELVFSGRKARA